MRGCGREVRRGARRAGAGVLLVVALSSMLLDGPAAALPAPMPGVPGAAVVVGAIATPGVDDTATVLPRRSGVGHRVVYSLSAQRVWTVGGRGRVQRTYLVSGQLSQPGPGTYRVYSRSRWTSSSVSPETMQYMVRFAHGLRTGAPIGFHSIPQDGRGRLTQSVDDLGRPLSHGCVRQRLADARFLWRFAPVGTRVVVTR